MVHFTYNDMGSMSLGAVSDTPSTPAITADHKGAARQQAVGGSDNSIYSALAGAIAVIKKVFGIGIVDRHDREL